MPEIQQPTELHEEPTDSAELKLRKTPDDLSLEAKLPQRNAADLLPMTALVAGNAGPTLTILYAGATLPWGAIVAVAMAQLAVTAFTTWWCRRG